MLKNRNLNVMKWNFLAVLFLIVFLARQATCYPPPEPREKIEDLEEKVSILTNEFRRLKEDVDSLKAESPSVEPELDLLPLEITREVLPGQRKAKFTLKYRAALSVLEDVRAFWMNLDTYKQVPEYISNEIPVVPLNEGEFISSIVTDASYHSDVTVSIGVPTLWYRLYVKNSANFTLTEQIDTFPELEIKPEGDIVYEPFTNASLQVTVPRQERPRHPGDMHYGANMDYTFFMTRPGTDILLRKFGDRDVLEDFVNPAEEPSQYFDSMEVTLNLTTQDVAYSGLLDITAGLDIQDNFLIRVEKGVRKVVRPSNQTGPFRPGLLIGETSQWVDRDDSGNFLDACRNGTFCQVICEFYGTDLQEVQILRTTNGYTENVTPVSRGANRFHAYLLHVFNVTRDQGTVNHTCVERDAGGRTKTVTFLTSYAGPPPVFVEEQTYLHELRDSEEVNVTCTARGNPLPSMKLTFSSNWEEFSSEDLQIIYQRNDTISVTKVFPMPRDNFDDYKSATCEATNAEGTTYSYL